MHENQPFTLISTIDTNRIQMAMQDAFHNGCVWSGYASEKLKSDFRQTCIFKRFPALPVRPDGKPGYYAPKEWADQCVLTINASKAPNVMSIVRDIMTDCGYTKLGVCLISEMAHGAEVKEHRDEGEYFEQFHRIHVPLQACENSLFTVGGETRFLKPGEIWLVDNTLLHNVKVTDQGTRRVSLYFDAA